MIDPFLGFALVSTDNGVTREIERSRAKSTQQLGVISKRWQKIRCPAGISSHSIKKSLEFTTLRISQIERAYFSYCFLRHHATSEVLLRA